ncbi:MAG: hypothetical protein U1D31_00800 [Patescibacteria group bacterium]|nr:hypothetical protein [bacterium]MDZ4240661.1 hypothetical protein [Patescibacteria group bacterium]
MITVKRQGEIALIVLKEILRNRGIKPDTEEIRKQAKEAVEKLNKRGANLSIPEATEFYLTLCDDLVKEMKEGLSKK